MTNKEKIQELKNFNPTVYKALAMVRLGFTYEEALEAAVVALAEEQTNLQKQAEHLYQNIPIPVINEIPVLKEIPVFKECSEELPKGTSRFYKNGTLIIM